MFERALSAIPPEASYPIWKKYVEYETQYGDLTNLYGIEKRRDAVFPNEDVNSIESVEAIAEKWTYCDIDHVGKNELGIEALRKHVRTSVVTGGTKGAVAEKRDTAVLPAIMMVNYRVLIVEWNGSIS